MSDAPTASTIDLHTHSTSSDGLFPPAELVERAHTAGLTTIALTDHDTTNGVAEAQAAGRAIGVEVIPGIEVNTYTGSGAGEAHVLGYFLDVSQERLQRHLSFLRDARERRGERMVQALRAAGIAITWDRVRELAHGSVGRPHLAQALIEQGYASTMPDAFDRYLTPGQPGYVPRFRLAPVAAVQLIRSAYGVPVLAHPAGIQSLDGLLTDLTAVGLLGMECYYGQYDEATVLRLLDTARHHALIATGGSDYHGPGVHPTPLGGRYVPPEAVTALRTAATDIRQQPAQPFVMPQPETSS